jgi:outer membrane protein TolC
LLPSAYLAASATYEQQSTRGALGAIASTLPGYSRGIRDYSVGPAASWEIDLFGGLRRAGEASRAEAEAAEAEQVGTRIIVAADAVDAYLQVRGYQARLAVALQQIGVALSDYYPKFSLSTALGFESLGSNHLFSSQAFQPLGGGALRWRLFDFGKVDAEVAQARGAHAEALAVYRQSVLKAVEDVEDSLTALVQTSLRMNEVQDQVDSLVKARDLSEQAYRAGSITLTDVLDADNQLLTARDEVDASRANAARAAVGVYRALGGGWTPGAEKRVIASVSAE